MRHISGTDCNRSFVLAVSGALEWAEQRAAYQGERLRYLPRRCSSARRLRRVRFVDVLCKSDASTFSLFESAPHRVAVADS